MLLVGVIYLVPYINILYQVQQQGERITCELILLYSQVDIFLGSFFFHRLFLGREEEDFGGTLG